MKLAAARSTPDPGQLSEWLSRRYPGLGPVQCRLERLSFHDTYRVAAGTGERWVLRLYGPDRRDADDIRYELELLEHLSEHGAAVSTALPGADGERLQSVEVAEGTRFVALFHRAPGEPLTRAPSAAEVSRFTAAVAALHLASEGFKPSGPNRQMRDLGFLLDGTLAYLERHATGLIDVADLRARAETVRGAWLAHIDRLDRGVVHMDAHVGNCFFSSDAVTFFDFDFAGPGFRIADLLELLVFALVTREPALFEVGVEGYRSRRALPDRDLQALETLLPAVLLWSIKLNLQRAQSTGLHAADLGNRVRRFRDAVGRLERGESLLQSLPRDF